MTPSTSLPNWSQILRDMFFCYQWLNSEPILIPAGAWIVFQKTYISLKTGFQYWHWKLLYVHTNFTVSISYIIYLCFWKHFSIHETVLSFVRAFSLPSPCWCAFQTWFPCLFQLQAVIIPWCCLFEAIQTHSDEMEVTSNGSHILLHSQAEFSSW